MSSILIKYGGGALVERIRRVLRGIAGWGARKSPGRLESR